MDKQALEKIFHETSRLAIVCELLKSKQGADFSALKQACTLTDGNLSAHLKKLEDARIIKIKKAFVEKRPKTTVTLTAQGRRSFAEYIVELEALLSGAAKRISQIEAEEQKHANTGPVLSLLPKKV